MALQGREGTKEKTQQKKLHLSSTSQFCPQNFLTQANNTATKVDTTTPASETATTLPLEAATHDCVTFQHAWPLLQRYVPQHTSLASIHPAPQHKREGAQLWPVPAQHAPPASAQLCATPAVLTQHVNVNGQQIGCEGPHLDRRVSAASIFCAQSMRTSGPRVQRTRQGRLWPCK